METQREHRAETVGAGGTVTEEPRATFIGFDCRVLKDTNVTEAKAAVSNTSDSSKQP